MEADHGDLATDVRDTLAQLAAFLTDPEAGAMFRALAGWAQQDAPAATRFRAEVVEPQRERDRAPFLRARHRRHLPRRFDIESAIDRSTGPVFARVLLAGPPLTPDFLDTLVTAALDGRDRDAVAVDVVPACSDAVAAWRPYRAAADRSARACSIAARPAWIFATRALELAAQRPAVARTRLSIIGGRKKH